MGAPGTIGQLVDQVQDRFGIDLPLADLFYWGTDRARTDLITSAVDIGPATIDGVATEQYALRQPGLDWQIWIQKGDQPLPLELVLTTTTEPTQPQHVIMLRWNLHARHPDSTFTFTRNRSSKPIQLMSIQQRTRSDQR